MTREMTVGTGAGLDTADMVLNIGPQHPSTHGVLRLKLTLDGERVVACDPIVGYMHRGAEKLFEVRTTGRSSCWPIGMTGCPRSATSWAWCWPSNG